MYSGEGEEVPFMENLYPKGNVEDWLLEVERVMRESLRKIIGESLKDYKEVRVERLVPKPKLSIHCRLRAQIGCKNGQVK